MTMALKTINEQYAEIHNVDIDDITNLLCRRAPERYYTEYADKRIAKHLRLYEESRETFKPENIFAVECLHVGTDSTGTAYTEQELRRAAPTLSFRPLDINHARKFKTGGNLPFPENQTLWMDYNPTLQAVAGHIQLDNQHSWLVRLGKIATVSVEFYNLTGVEGRDIVFSGLSLVQDANPADRRARIFRGPS